MVTRAWTQCYSMFELWSLGDRASNSLLPYLGTLLALGVPTPLRERGLQRCLQDAVRVPRSFMQFGVLEVVRGLATI